MRKCVWKRLKVGEAQHVRDRRKMTVSSMSCFMLVTIVMMLTKCTARSRLSLWIDAGQVETITGKWCKFVFFLHTCAMYTVRVLHKHEFIRVIKWNTLRHRKLEHVSLIR